MAGQTLLIHEMKSEYEYDRDLALRAWKTVLALIPEGDDRGYAEYDRMTDEDRIIGAFELLEGSQFGDMIFGSLANDDQGSNLVTRKWDE